MNKQYMRSTGLSEDIPVLDIFKISRLLNVISKAYCFEGRKMNSYEIGRNVDHGNIYIWSEDLGVSVLINDDIDKVCWVYTDPESGKEIFFNTYTQFKKYIN